LYNWGGYGYGYGYPGYGYGYGGYRNGGYYSPSYSDWGYSSPSYGYPSAGSYPSTSFYYGPSSAPSRPTLSPNQALLEVILPDADAELFVQDQPMSQLGTQRSFYSPELTEGKTYTYTVVMRRDVNGRAVDETKKVDVRAGSRVVVDFTRIPAPPKPPVPRLD
jgi:uncharacterized protein (TIGR03000 family)